MPAELLQLPVLTFAGMMLLFFITLAFVAIEDGLRR